MEAKIKIFAGSASKEIGSKIAQSYGTALGSVTFEKFSDGELSVHFNESVRGCDVFLVQSTYAPTDNIMELLLMIDAARRASARQVIIVAPYFGYARQDRKDKARVAIGAKMVANILSATGADRLMTCDLHADQIQGFFDFPVDHFDGASIFIPYVKSLNLENIIVASPDVGGMKRARSFAKILKAELVVCDKHRERANQVASMQLIGDVEGADVILVDDLIDTGGTIARAAQLILDKGAKSVRAICTHGVLSGNAFENINASVLEELVISNTIPLVEKSPKIKVLDIGALFGTGIKMIENNASISSLFIRE